MKPIEKFEPRDLGPRTWGVELLVAHTPQYIGKLLTMTAGSAGGLQYHVEKDETLYLLTGRAMVTSDQGDGTLIVRPMYAGESYHIPPGAPHRVEALTDCVFFETSTPHFDDRVRVERDYGLPEGGGLPTTR